MAYLMADFRQLNLTNFKTFLKRVEKISNNSSTEECGIITDLNFYHLKNVAKKNKEYFQISQEEYFNIFKREEIKIIWHSHVEKNELPSDFDTVTQKECLLPYIIYSKKTKNFCYLDQSNCFSFALL